MDATSVRSRVILRYRAGAVTDQGQKRDLNEDAVFQRTTANGAAGLYLVCDGLGGFQAGEVASRLAVETVVADLVDVLAQAARSDAPPMIPERLVEAIKAANAAIRDYAEAQADDIFSLGTTLTLALLDGRRAYIANVGDGRAYGWRAGQLTQITRDHSVVAQLVRRGQLAEDEMADHPQSNILSRAIGVENHVEVDLFRWDVQPGDKLLLCSDGLWKAFPPDKLTRLLAQPMAAPNLCELLVAEAKWRDGSDNISAIIVEIEGESRPLTGLETRPLAGPVALAS